MDPEKDTLVTPEEQKAEQEALAEAKDDEIRATLVSSLGLEETDGNRELIDKLVAREKDNRSKLSGAIRQKVNWRDKATKQAAPKPASATPQDQGKFDPETVRKQTEETVKAQLEQRDLDEMEHSDEIKAEIKKIAQLQNVSVRKAEKDPYIQHLIAQAESADRVNEAAVSRTPRSTTVRTDAAPKFNMATEEGRKQFHEWQQSRKR